MFKSLFFYPSHQLIDNYSSDDTIYSKDKTPQRDLKSLKSTETEYY